MERRVGRQPSSGLHLHAPLALCPAVARLRCQRRRQRPLPLAAAGAQTVYTDVAVVGAGIIGLCTSLQLLRADPTLRVVLLDAKQPCAGATGAGQGYLWLSHRDPDSPAWTLATHSKALWARWLAPGPAALPARQLSPEAVEWQPTGSALLATTAAEAEALAARQRALQRAGVEAEWVDAAALATLEPALRLGGGGGEGAALLVPADAQLSGRAAAAAVLAACEGEGGARFEPLFHEGAEGLAASAGPSGRVDTVETSAGRRVRAGRGVVVAAGAWSGGLLARALGEARWAEAFRPRRGHLLELRRPEGMPPLRRGVMEAGYTKHYAAAGAAAAGAAAEEAAALDVTFTATTSAAGTLLVGSSREFSGWRNAAEPEVVEAIMARATAFLPGLAAVRPDDVSVRVGLRPYAVVRRPRGEAQWLLRGSPMVGAVPGAEGLLLAAGHEGSGLTLGPATAELLADLILGRPPALGAGTIAALQPVL